MLIVVKYLQQSVDWLAQRFEIRMMNALDMTQDRVSAKRQTHYKRGRAVLLGGWSVAIGISRFMVLLSHLRRALRSWRPKSQ